MEKNNSKSRFLRGDFKTIFVFSILIVSFLFALNVNADDLAVSCSSSPNPAVAGQTVTYSATATGGDGNYTYTWGQDCSGSSLTCQTSYAAAGAYTATLSVKSGDNQTASTECNVIVKKAPDLTASCSPSVSSAFVNQTITYSSSVSGGNGIYTYTWGQDCSGSSLTCQTSYSQPNIYTATLSVNSGDGQSVTTDCPKVTINKAANLAVSCSSSPNPAVAGQTVTYSATATGGDGNYTYTWGQDCSGSSLTCQTSYAAAGAYTATLSVKSGDNQTASTECNVAVKKAGNPGPLNNITIGAAGGSQTVALGNTLQFTAQGTDASGNPITGLTFTWQVVPGTGAGTINASGLFTPTSAGTVTITATSGGITGTTGTITITNNPNVNPGPASSAFISASSTTMNVGDTITLTITVKDASGNLVSDGTSINLVSNIGTVGGSTNTTSGVVTRTFTSNTAGTVNFSIPGLTLTGNVSITINSGGGNSGNPGGGALGGGTTNCQKIPGDINGDGFVNKYDLALMMANWLKAGLNAADFNKDSTVDKLDFAILMLNWLKNGLACY